MSGSKLTTPPGPPDKREQKAVKVVLFVLVLFACIVGGFVGYIAGWRAGSLALALLMLPAVAIYRFSGPS
jgi:hypothetical protein